MEQCHAHLWFGPAYSSSRNSNSVGGAGKLADFGYTSLALTCLSPKDSSLKAQSTLNPAELVDEAREYVSALIPVCKHVYVCVQYRCCGVLSRLALPNHSDGRLEAWLTEAWKYCKPM